MKAYHIQRNKKIKTESQTKAPGLQYLKYESSTNHMTNQDVNFFSSI